MNISLEQFKKHIENSPLDEKAKAELIAIVEPCFHFRNFLMEKHKVTAEETELIVQLQIAAKRDELYGDMNEMVHLSTDDYTLLIVNRMGNIMREFAIKEGYDKADDFVKAIETLLLVSLQEGQRVKQFLN